MRLWILTALLVCAANAALSQDRAVPQSQAQVQLSYAPIVARARTISRGIRSSPIRKFWRDRWVCAPQ